MTVPHTRLRRFLAALATTAVVGTIALVGGTAPASAAVSTAGFDPGLIISDSIFFDATAMSASDVQVFLDSKGASCRAAGDGTPCLKDYRQDTPTRGATDRCAVYQGAGNERASEIIAKVAVACGVNPQVILTTLQKEQSLVTASGGSLTPTRYRSAMGYGCPDTAACDSTYYGFFNQVYAAASQFRNYVLNPTRYAYRVGVVAQVLYSPNRACGSSPVLIQSAATAALYNYTPYQPNAAALAAGLGTGDGCSSYGNRNFWVYFTSWFGPTTEREPIASLDAVSTSLGTVTVAGWALDPDTTSSIWVHVYVDNAFATATLASGSRPDVAAVYGKGDLHGFAVALPVSGGTHQVCLYAIDAQGGVNPQFACRTVTVVNHEPIGTIDTARTSPTAVTLSGWAFDPDTSSPISVHYYIDGRWSGAVTASSPRPDVAAVYGNGDLHGYTVTLPASAGTHTVCAYGIDTSGGVNAQIACRTFTIASLAPTPPTGVIDSVVGGAGTVVATGWAFDPNTSGAIVVQMTLDGVLVSSAPTSATRADVAQVYGLATQNHGYRTTVYATAGNHTLCVNALDSDSSAPSSLGCRDVTVTDSGTNAMPFGVIDSAVPTPGSVTVTGWAIDPDTSTPIGVHVYVDGAWAGAGTAGLSRPDVDQAYGHGPSHGYSITVPLAPGPHTVCTYGIDATGGPNPGLACVEVTGQ